MKQLTPEEEEEAFYKHSELPICGYLRQSSEFGLRINLRRDKLEGVCCLEKENCHRKMPSGNPEKCPIYRKYFGLDKPPE